MAETSNKNLQIIRKTIQWLFLLWVVGIGIRFGLFVSAAEHGAAAPPLSRPPSVEGFLPIGALTSLKYWLVSGVIHPVHPAALVIFLAIVAMSIVAKKSFCSWLCPVGTISESIYTVGHHWIPAIRMWPWLDVLLRGVKYLLLLFFVKIILVDMPVEALGGFLDAPYWAASDVKMLGFFMHMSMATLIVLVTLAIFSVVYRNFWCRYLCPYGALLGLVSLLSPFKIRRVADRCSGCQRCSRACPASLPVHSAKTVSSPECSGCLSCVTDCPEADALAMQPVIGKRRLPVWVYPSVVIITFVAAIGVGMLSGHWTSSLTYSDYRQLVPLLPYLNH